MVSRPATRAAAALLALTCAQACAATAHDGARLQPLPNTRSLGATVESSDPALNRALTKLALVPSAATHRAVAREYRRLKIDDAAFDHLTAATKLAPADAAAYDELARIWRDWGFPNMGLGDSARAVYHAPRSAAVHNTRGTLFAALGQKQDARREFEVALSLDPGASFAAENLCRLDRLEGKASVDLRCSASVQDASRSPIGKVAGR
jgi:tetratricopeptide (TPR) repeat protein